MMKSASLRSRAKNCLRLLGVLAILLMLAISGLLIAWAVRESGDRTILRKKYADLRARGAPVDNASMTHWYHAMTDATDVAEWQSIFAEMRSQEFSQWCTGVAGLDSQNDERADTRSTWANEPMKRNLIAKTEPLRARIRELVAKRTPVQFVTHFDSISTQLPHLQDLKRVQQLLAIAFQVAFVDRDPKNCYSTINAMLGVSQLCGKEPLFVSHRENLVLHDMALRKIHLAIEYDTLNEEQIDELLKTMSRDEIALHRLSHMVQGERAAMIEVAENLAKYPGFDMTSYSERTLPEILVQTTNRDIVHLLDFYEAVEKFDISNIDLLQLQSLEHSKDIDNRVRSAKTWEKMDWAITSRLTPSVITTLEALVLNAVQERFIRTALAIRLYRKRFGRYPDDLESLRAIGFDSERWKPWGGKPFGYRVCDGEVILWGTHPQEGQFTTEDPPHLDERSALLDEQKKLYVLLQLDGR